MRLSLSFFSQQTLLDWLAYAAGRGDSKAHFHSCHVRVTVTNDDGHQRQGDTVALERCKMRNVDAGLWVAQKISDLL